YDNPDGLIAAPAIVQAIVYIVVALRFEARYKHGRKYFTSDWLIRLAAFLSTGLTIVQIHGTELQRLATWIRANDRKVYQWAIFLNGVVVTGLVKISVSFFYLQIFSVKYRHIILPWLVLMTAWTVGFTILMLTFCGHH
ncbi:hypothetical protein BU23DRAFT_434439, partial [Bimuria novae-zelandiae CBS 107.79]